MFNAACIVQTRWKMEQADTFTYICIALYSTWWHKVNTQSNIIWKYDFTSIHWRTKYSDSWIIRHPKRCLGTRKKSRYISSSVNCLLSSIFHCDENIFKSNIYAFTFLILKQSLSHVSKQPSDLPVCSNNWQIMV